MNKEGQGIQQFDSWDRWWVPSDRNPKERYLVNLTDYAGNGSCCCKQFSTKLEPLLRRSIAPEDALEGKLVRIKDGIRPKDALRCKHLLEARAHFLDRTIRALQKNTTKPQEPPPCYGKTRYE